MVVEEVREVVEATEEEATDDAGDGPRKLLLLG